MTRRFWAGAMIVAASIVLYGLHGITSWYDLAWHGLPFLLGCGLMLGDSDFRAALLTIRSVFGKGEPK